MFRALSDWFYRFSNGYISLLAFLIFVGFSIIFLPDQAKKSAVFSEGIGAPDTSLFYTPTDLYNMADTYGVEGRQAYIKARFTFDLVFPFIYTLFLITSLSIILARVFPFHHRYRLLNLVPFIAMIFDFLENISTSLVLARFPQPTIIIDWLAPIFTIIKWISLGCSFSLLFLGLVVVAIHWSKLRG